MEKCHYPVPAQAIYDPDFTPITTSSPQIFRVNEWAHQYVTNDGYSGSTIVIMGETVEGTQVPVLVDNSGIVKVRVEDTPGEQRGSCTNPTTTGEIDYDSTDYSILDTIVVPVGKTLEIHGLHSAGNLQAQVELIIDQEGTITKLLVGIITETTPNWSPHMGAPLEVVGTSPQTVTLRIKSLRCPDSVGQGTGRIFARLV